MGKSVAIIFLLCFAGFGYGQDSLCVFNLKGTAYSKTSKKIEPITKGVFINKAEIILLSESSELIAINAKGDAFKVDKTGEYKFNNILSKPVIKNTQGLTKKYFKIIWDQLLKKKSGKTVIGGVFRGDVLMDFPKDSIKWAGSKITFKWKTIEDTSQYYLFVKNLKTDQILKLATNGNELALYKTNAFFSEGNIFQWAVTTIEFPNLKNIPFYTLEYIDKATYETEKAKYTILIKDLKLLGLSSSEIEDSLCESYGICKK